MIGSLFGKVDLLQRPHALIDVNGVGYKILVSDNTYKNFMLGKKVKVYTYTFVREDALELFGFLELDDLKLFENLITVSGIGPRTALNIFSFGDRKSIIEAIVKGDALFFTSVPRLGTKNAQRIIIELKNKMGGEGVVDLSGADFIENKEVIDALKNFGFSASEAQKALRGLSANGLSTEEKIKQALKALGK